MMKPTSATRSRAYKEAGVNIEKGYELVTRIKTMLAETHVPGVLSDIGGFGGLFKPDVDNTESPVLVASTDGVGTKLKLAIEWNCHEQIGIDLVAMSVNDILVQGAKPLFFLDYFATGHLDPDLAEKVIRGIAEGCKQASCALLGGETAEMPDMYQAGDYDLAGFCVGMVGNNEIVDGSSVKVGDLLVGLASSGPHANGYSLIRTILKKSRLSADAIFPGTDKTVREIFLAPTVIYQDYIKNILRDTPVNSMAHITGGGFYENIPRALPAQVKAVIRFGSWTIPPVFSWLAETGSLTWQEMLQIFNCGIGYILVLNQNRAEDVINRLKAMQMDAWVIGVIERLGQDAEQVEMLFDEQTPTSK